MAVLDRLRIFYHTKFPRRSNFLWRSRFPWPKCCRNSRT